jgi:hypothetical protein
MVLRVWGSSFSQYHYCFQGELFAIILNPWTLPHMCRNNEWQTHTISLGFLGFDFCLCGFYGITIEQTLQKIYMTSKLKLTSLWPSNFYIIYSHSNIWNLFQKKKMMVACWPNVEIMTKYLPLFLEVADSMNNFPFLAWHSKAWHPSHQRF